MINEIQYFIAQMVEGKHLDRMQAGRAFQIMMVGGATPAQAAGLLIALRTKGETVDEIMGAAEAMRVKMETITPVPGAIDVCGTGGDAAKTQGTYNISTAVSLVVAACGVPVVKHGNKSVSSTSGSADVLAALGVNIHAERARTERALAECNIGFLYAPLYHKAMRHVAPVRQELGVRTLFNLLGPLVNPAQPALQLMGIYERALLEPMARVLAGLGSSRAWIVHGSDGMDELTLTGPSYVAELKDGEIRHFTVTPEEAGLSVCEPGMLKGGRTPAANAQELALLLGGKVSAYRDIVLLNAAAALMIADKAPNLQEGVVLAASAIDSGKAKETLAHLVRITATQAAHV